MNRYHELVTIWLTQMGVTWVEEYPVGPYSIDIYLKDFNRGVEIDGPWHSKPKDLARDAKILEEYGIEIVRIKVATSKGPALEAILK